MQDRAARPGAPAAAEAGYPGPQHVCIEAGERVGRGGRRHAAVPRPLVDEQLWISRTLGWDLLVPDAPPHSGRWHRDAHRFLKRHPRELAPVPVAVFAMGHAPTPKTCGDVPAATSASADQARVAVPGRDRRVRRRRPSRSGAASGSARLGRDTELGRRHRQAGGQRHQPRGLNKRGTRPRRKRPPGLPCDHDG